MFWLIQTKNGIPTGATIKFLSKHEAELQLEKLQLAASQDALLNEGSPFVYDWKMEELIVV